MNNVIKDEVIWNKATTREIEEFDLQRAKELAFFIVRLIEFKRKEDWYDISFHMKCLEILEKGYNLSFFQERRVRNAYEILVNNLMLDLSRVGKEEPSFSIWVEEERLPISEDSLLATCFPSD